MLKRKALLITLPFVYYSSIVLKYVLLMLGSLVFVSFLLVSRTVSLGGVVARFELPPEARSSDPVRQAIFQQPGSIRAWFAPSSLEAPRVLELSEAYEPSGGPLPVPRPKRRRRRR